MAKQWCIATKNPAAGRPEWFIECGIGFNSLAAAEQSRRGTIEALKRAKDPLTDREWVIIEIDINRMVGPPVFFERVRWAFKYIFSGYRTRIREVTTTELNLFKKETVD